MVCQVKYFNGFDPIWNNALRECLFMVFYLTFSFCYLVFTMYIRPLGIITQGCGVKYHLYADDTQLYISLDPNNELNFSSSLKNVEHCIADIRLWITQSLLKLNDNKANILYLASPHCVKSLKTSALQMGAYSNGSVNNLWGILTNILACMPCCLSPS